MDTDNCTSLPKSKQLTSQNKEVPKASITTKIRMRLKTDYYYTATKKQVKQAGILPFG